MSPPFVFDDVYQRERDRVVGELLGRNRGDDGWGEAIWKPLGLPSGPCLNGCGTTVWFYKNRAGHRMMVCDQGYAHHGRCSAR